MVHMLLSLVQLTKNKNTNIHKILYLEHEGFLVTDFISATLHSSK